MEKPFSELTAEERWKINELARHQLIHRVYADILMDMQICKFEGWDTMGFIKQLQELLNSFRRNNHDRPERGFRKL